MINHDVTAIVVSHQLERVASLCKRAVLLRQGEVAHAGPAAETIAAYVNGVNEDAAARARGLAAPDSDRRADFRWTDRLRQSHPAPRRLRRARPGSGRRHVPGSADPGAIDAERKGALRHHVDASGRLAQRAGGFALDVTLQLNIAPGVYAIETVVFDDLVQQRAQLIANGPWVTVTVQEGKSFHGEVQMNPEMTLARQGRPASPGNVWPAAATRGRRRSRGATGAAAPGGTIVSMKIFVVIATREREALLARTLASLAQCRPPEGFAGTLVVENGRRAGTERVVRDAPARLDPRYLFEAAGNKSKALNAALAQIDDGLVVFLDDDVRVGPDLLEVVRDRPLVELEPGQFFGGPVEPDYEAAPPTG